MNLGNPNQRFGITWLFFGYTLALHVLDEAGNNFLSYYIPNALAIRRAMPFLPIPLFTFRSWIGSLLCALTIWLLLSLFAFQGMNWTRILAIPVALVAGLANGTAHIVSSIYLGRLMPGMLSAPLMLLSGYLLLRSALRNGLKASATE